MVQMKRVRLVTALAVGVLVLAGCGNQQQAASSSNRQSSTSQSSSTAQQGRVSTKTRQTAALWNQSKDDQLQDFINDWAPTMHQSYDKYTGSETLTTSAGNEYPHDLSRVSIDGTHPSIGFTRDGRGSYAYKVVAIYNYDDDNDGHITYFFTFHDGQPMALVDQSSSDTPDLTETKNTKVKEQFAEIAGTPASDQANANSASTSSSSSSTSAAPVRDLKTLGILARLKAFGHDDLASETTLAVYKVGDRYWIGTGTKLSNTGFTVDGDNLTYYTLNTSGGRSTAEGTYDPHTVSIKSLQDEFYSTAAQKQDIDAAVQRMPAIDDQTE